MFAYCRIHPRQWHSDRWYSWRPYHQQKFLTKSVRNDFCPLYIFQQFLCSYCHRGWQHRGKRPRSCLQKYRVHEDSDEDQLEPAQWALGFSLKDLIDKQFFRDRHEKRRPFLWQVQRINLSTSVRHHKRRVNQPRCYESDPIWRRSNIFCSNIEQELFANMIIEMLDFQRISR